MCPAMQNMGLPAKSCHLGIVQDHHFPGLTQWTRRVKAGQSRGHRDFFLLEFHRNMSGAPVRDKTKYFAIDLLPLLDLIYSTGCRAEVEE